MSVGKRQGEGRPGSPLWDGMLDMRKLLQHTCSPSSNLLPELPGEWRSVLHIILSCALSTQPCS